MGEQVNLAFVKATQDFVVRNSHHILTGLALLGLGASVALSVHADRQMQEWYIDDFKRLTKEQRIRIYAKSSAVDANSSVVMSRYPCWRSTWKAYASM
mgnify:CR=1 FL=1